VRGYDAGRWYREVKRRGAVADSRRGRRGDRKQPPHHSRFELEQDLLAEKFPLEQLPEEWNRRMWDYLRIEVPDDTHGVLQDVHWSSGSLGYFPNVCARQPDLGAALGQGVARPA